MIALAQAFLVLFASQLNFRVAIFLFFTFLAFSPRSLGLLLGGAEFSLTFVRFTFPLLLALYLVSYITTRTKSFLSAQDLLKNKVFGMIIVMGFYKIVATLVNGVNPLYAVENLVFSAGAFALFYLASTYNIFRTTSCAVVFSCVLIIVIVVIELIIKTPLHFFIANPVLFQEGILEIKVTDRGYRAQAIFDHSLSLAEYLLYAFPIVLFWRTLQDGKTRLLLTVVLLGMILSGFMTNSRGFYLFGSVTLVSYWFFFNWHRLTGMSKTLTLLPLIPVLLFTVLASGLMLAQSIEQAEVVSFSEIDSAAERSTISRVLQYQEVFTLVSQRPFFGYGVLQEYSKDLDEIRHIDSYYLRTALEAGFVGMSLFFVFLGITFREMLSNQVNNRTKESRAFFAMSLSLFVAFAGAKVFLSMPTNNFIFFALLGLILGLKKRQVKNYTNAYSSCT